MKTQQESLLYKDAVLKDLIKRGKTTDEASLFIHDYFEILIKTWHMELNVEHFVDEMFRCERLVKRVPMDTDVVFKS
jgi:hypothetical protein